MAGPLVLIFHRPAAPDEAPLARLLAAARLRLAEQQAALFRSAGAGEVRLVEARHPSFGQALAAEATHRGGLVVMGSGSVPRLGGADASRLIEVARSGRRDALTNNRYSSDVCAIGDAGVLATLPPLPSDNALPRWLEEHAGHAVAELPGRGRLALDIDTPLDIGLWALVPRPPRWVFEMVEQHQLDVPRRDELRRLAANPHGELLIFGRAGSATLRWLERNVRCRVRFLAEERGLRASSALAIGGPARRPADRPPRASLGLLLDDHGPAAVAEIVGRLGDGAIIDSRVLMAHHFGADESAWPAPGDRYASDLLRATEISHAWLRALTAAAAASDAPIALGSHSLVGPGVRLLLGARPAVTD